MAGKTSLRKLFNGGCNYLSTSRRCVSNSAIQMNSEGGWLNNLFVRKIEPTKESHSQMLSDKDILYELQTHTIKPGSEDNYLKNYEIYIEALKDKNLRTELKGSWSVLVGDQDQFLHLWSYEKGYNSIDATIKASREDKDLNALLKDRNSYLRRKENQILLAFSFWPPITPRTGSHIYEIRSYFLHPGTMIEWGNNWARGIQHRQAYDEAFGGFFSQIGRLYNVHHIWCYKSLTERREAREATWHKEGWADVVSHTVPLITETHTRLLVGTEFSPAL